MYLAVLEAVASSVTNEWVGIVVNTAQLLIIESDGGFIATVFCTSI